MSACLSSVAGARTAQERSSAVLWLTVLGTCKALNQCAVSALISLRVCLRSLMVSRVFARCRWRSKHAVQTREAC